MMKINADFSIPDIIHSMDILDLGCQYWNHDKLRNEIYFYYSDEDDDPYLRLKFYQNYIKYTGDLIKESEKKKRFYKNYETEDSFVDNEINNFVFNYFKSCKKIWKR